jgi:hypothetical protein
MLKIIRSRKEAKLQWLHDPSGINGDPAGISGIKRGNT